MAQAPKRLPPRPEEALAPKRRRFSPDEVCRELEAAGKRQPVLSFLLGSAPVEVEGLAAARRTRRAEGAAQGPPGSGKRPRQCEAGIPPLTELLPVAQVPRQLSLVRPRPSTGLAQLSPVLRPAGMMVDPRGTAFVVTDGGYLLAELPPCWRPGITLAGNRFVQIARVAIDAAGTAYLFSDQGLPVTAVPAVGLAADACSADVKIQMLGQKTRAGTPYPGWQSQAASAAEEPLSPPMSVPSSGSTDAEGDIDVAMDCETV